jgi:hypothetical protein
MILQDDLLDALDFLEGAPRHVTAHLIEKEHAADTSIGGSSLALLLYSIPSVGSGRK